MFGGNSWSKDFRCQANYQKLRYRLLKLELLIEKALKEE